jgi:hypothetical protein
VRGKCFECVVWWPGSHLAMMPYAAIAEGYFLATPGASLPSDCMRTCGHRQGMGTRAAVLREGGLERTTKGGRAVEQLTAAQRDSPTLTRSVGLATVIPIAPVVRPAAILMCSGMSPLWSLPT